jgi:hypothetical protein
MNDFVIFLAMSLGVVSIILMSQRGIFRAPSLFLGVILSIASAILWGGILRALFAS